MTAQVEQQGSALLVSAPAWLVPGDAAAEWVALQLVLEVVGDQVPCAAEPERWFAPRTRPAVLEAAVAGCGVCPVRVECSAYALADREVVGVWGGTTERERRAARGAGA